MASQQIESWDQNVFGLFSPYTHLCSGTIQCLCVRERERERETFLSNKGGISNALAGRWMRGLSITAVVRINPETSIRRQRPSEIAASGEREGGWSIEGERRGVRERWIEGLREDQYQGRWGREPFPQWQLKGWRCSEWGRGRVMDWRRQSGDAGTTVMVSCCILLQSEVKYAHTKVQNGVYGNISPHICGHLEDAHQAAGWSPV